MKTRIGHAHGRRLLSLLLALVICFGAIGLGTLTASAANRTGDTDGDGKVTAKDARFVLRLSARLETATAAQKAAAEVDGDGKITAKDARIILRVSARLTSFEGAARAQANRAKLDALGAEALADVSNQGYFAGYLYGADPDDEGIWTVFAIDSANRLYYYEIGDHPLAYLRLGGHNYLMDPDTAVCLDYTQQNARQLGVEYDTSLLTTQLYTLNDVLEKAEINTVSVTLEGKPAYRTSIRFAGFDSIEDLYTRDGKLVASATTDLSGNLSSMIIYSTATSTIPSGLLSASSYSLADSVSEFKRVTGMS